MSGVSGAAALEAAARRLERIAEELGASETADADAVGLAREAAQIAGEVGQVAAEAARAAAEQAGDAS